NLVAAGRMDGAQLGALSLATDKAFTAVSFGHPTSAWVDSSGPGGSDWGLAGTLGGRAIVFPGGVPLYADGHLVGGVGVSGTASLIDAECASAAAVACGLAVSR
ncbi:MAG: heme-binding protein, partial [Nakamurella sp.]